MTTTTITRKIGRNKGKPRLWIEGKALIESGLPHGTRWNLEGVYGGGLLITSDPEGARKVAGKVDRPVIDITGASLDPLRDAAGNMPEAVTLTFQKGSGLIEVCPVWPVASGTDTLPLAA